MFLFQPYVYEPPIIRVAHGSVFSEVVCFFNHITHTVRLYNVQGEHVLQLYVCQVAILAHICLCVSAILFSGKGKPAAKQNKIRDCNFFPFSAKLQVLIVGHPLPWIYILFNWCQIMYRINDLLQYIKLAIGHFELEHCILRSKEETHIFLII